MAGLALGLLLLGLLALLSAWASWVVRAAGWRTLGWAVLGLFGVAGLTSLLTWGLFRMGQGSSTC